MKDISLAFSSCPNDTFIFHAMLHGLIGRTGYNFNVHIADVEELNSSAFKKRYDVTKLSFHAYLKLKDRYSILTSGSALGFGCGPLLVKKDSVSRIEDMKIAIPGENTTAYMLLKLWNPEIKNISVERFDRIMQGVSDGIYDAGLIIHEGRFVFPEYGLNSIVDLGQWWEDETAMPIPLGCIVAKRSLGHEFHKDMSSVIKESLQHAFENRGLSRSYIKGYAQELDDSVIDEHINLYVNDFSLELGEKGMAAIELLEKMAIERGLIS